MVSQLSEELRDLQRSWLHVPLTINVESAVSQLATIEQFERNRLESTVMRLIRVGRSISQTELVFAEALLLEARHGLSQEDAIILGSVVEDLKQHQASDGVFTTKNWKDFGTPDIISNLQEWGCAFADSFSKALEMLNH